MRLGCHSLAFGAWAAEKALREIARAGYETAVLAEIPGQVQHASQLAGVPLFPLAALDVAAHERGRVGAGLEYVERSAISTLIVAPGGRPGGRPQIADLLTGARDAGCALAVTPRSGSAVGDVETALRLVQREPALWLWPDTSHLARAGERLPDAALSLAPFSAGWFIRDHDGRSAGPGSFESQVPGRGALDLEATLCALREASFGGPLVFHAVGHMPGGALRTEYTLERIRTLTREARAYLERYATSSSARPT